MFQTKRKVNIECLIENGENINQKDKEGNSSLMLAVKNCKGEYSYCYGTYDVFEEITEVLLKNGVDVNAVNNKSEKALDIAKKEEKINDKVIELLL